MAHSISVSPSGKPLLHSVEAYLQPARSTASREAGEIPSDSISRSYFLMRLLVGCLGLALPAVLLLGDLFFMGAKFTTRGSLSAYYHSGMRDEFVGILFVVGILLVTYKITERNRDNLFSFVAGIAAIGVALFPTNIPAGVGAVPTPLQDRLGQTFVATIHYGCAAMFIVCLGFMCRDFALRERERPQQRIDGIARHSPEFWYRFHMSMAVLIAVAAIYIIVTQSLGIFDRYSILIGECIVTVAFGLSWLFKGLELAVLPKITALKPQSAVSDLDHAA
jgi:hypothetical protein